MFISLQWGDTALVRAAEKGHTSTVKILVEHGAAVDIQVEVAILYAPHAQIILLNMDITIVACIIYDNHV